MFIKLETTDNWKIQIFSKYVKLLLVSSTIQLTNLTLNFVLTPVSHLFDSDFRPSAPTLLRTQVRNTGSHTQSPGTLRRI